MGFDYFYGFIGGETHQFYPVIFENTTAVEPAKTPEQGYHFMTDMTDKAIQYMKYQQIGGSTEATVHVFRPRGRARTPPCAQGMA